MSTEPNPLPAVPGVWARARADSGFRDRFVAAYLGDWDAMDALWWVAHPDAATPTGTQSPRREIDDLRGRLYSPNPLPDDAVRYRAAETAFLHQFALASSAVSAAALGTGVARIRARAVLRRVAVPVLGVALVVGALTFTLRDGQSAPLATTAPQARVESTDTGERVGEPAATGAVLARMSDLSPRLGGEWRLSGTTAFQSAQLSTSRQVLVTVSCRGGARLLLVAGPNGLNNGGFVAVDCPDSSVASVSAAFSRESTSTPFRLVAYERDPVQFKALLTTDPS